MELSVLTHLPFETLARQDDKILNTYIDVVREIERKRRKR